MEERTLVRDNASVVSNDSSGFSAYQNQKRLLQLRQSSDNTMMNEINTLKQEVQALRSIVTQLMIKVNDG